MKVPFRVCELLHALELPRDAEVARKRQAELAEQQRLAAIEALRQALMPELCARATVVFAWRQHFLSLPEASRILSFYGGSSRLTLFHAKFWRGEPVPDSVITTWARLVMADDGTLWYEECHKGQVSRELRCAWPEELISQVHPDFLKQLADHLAGPEAWTCVQDALERKAGLLK